MVRITYLLKSDKEPRILELLDEEYFDPIEDERDSFEVAGCAKHQYPHKYLDIEEEKVKWIIVEEPYENGFAVYRYQYLNSTNAFMIHSLFPNGDEEIVHSMQLATDKDLIIRTLKPKGKSSSTTMSSTINENEKVTELAHDWSWEDRKLFCDAVVKKT